MVWDSFQVPPFEDMKSPNKRVCAQIWTHFRHMPPNNIDHSLSLCVHWFFTSCVSEQKFPVHAFSGLEPSHNFFVIIAIVLCMWSSPNGYSLSTCCFFHLLNFKIFFLFFCFLGLHPQHMEVSRLGIDRIGAAAASHSNDGSKSKLWPAPQLTATPDP